MMSVLLARNPFKSTLYLLSISYRPTDTGCGTSPFFSRCKVRQGNKESRVDLPDHLFRIPRADGRSRVGHIYHVEALVVAVQERAPDALVAVDAADEQRRDAVLLQEQAERRLGAPQTRDAV